MPSQAFVLRIPLHKLLIGLLVTVVPISIAGLYSLSQSDRALESAIGAQFKTIATSTASEISRFVHDRVVHVGVVARQPEIVQEVVRANRAYEGMSEDAIHARIERIDKIWNTPEAAATVRAILASPASRALRQHIEVDKRFLRITVTDARGATIASTHKTIDYYQADEEYWQNIYADGRGAVSLTDILYDEVSKSNYIGVGVPVLEEGTNRFIGTVDALVDVSSLFPMVHRAELGRTARTLLVREDGTVIAAPQVSLSMNLKSPEFDTVRDALLTLPGRQTGYVVAEVSGRGRTLIGFADTGLREDYQALGWQVLVAQDAREAFAPVRMVGRLIAFMCALGLAMVTLLVVYFALHRREPRSEIEHVAHAKRAEESEAEEEEEETPAPK